MTVFTNRRGLTVQAVLQRLQDIDESLEHAVAGRTVGQLFAQREWWAKELKYAQQREGYPDSAA
jgi:hypothetical protein